MPVEGTASESRVRTAIRQRYGESRAVRYGISEEAFAEHVTAVVDRYGRDFSEAEKLELVATLHVEELALARACSDGNDAAWDEFLARFRHVLHAMATHIARDEAAGRELADGLYAELFGMPNREGRRISKLQYYMGRGSLQGWLRTVLAQKHVDRCRAQAKDVSLEEQVEAGAWFAAKDDAATLDGDGRVAATVEQVLAALSSEERFLLASYYLDRCTLAEIGRQLGVHESTISRKLDRLTDSLRKKIQYQLAAGGLNARQCDDLLAELDVRDLHVDVERQLRQERNTEPF
jgi:RNA polymerase sigma-70 factor (ECF subfamily)